MVRNGKWGGVQVASLPDDWVVDVFRAAFELSKQLVRSGVHSDV